MDKPLTQVSHPFGHKTPTPESTDKMDRVRQGCQSLYETLLEMTPCRERSLAMTKLEEVAMWANKGIVLNQ